MFNSVNELMHSSLSHLEPRWLSWVGLFLLSVSLLLNYYLYTFLKYNKSIFQTLSSSQTLNKAWERSGAISFQKPHTLSTKEEGVMNPLPKKKLAIPLFSGEMKDLTDEEILKLLEGGKLHAQHLEKFVGNFERAVLLRRLHAGKYFILLRSIL